MDWNEFLKRINKLQIDKNQDKGEFIEKSKQLETEKNVLQDEALRVYQISKINFDLLFFSVDDGHQKGIYD